MTLVRTTIDTPIGELTLVASDRGLRAVLWPVDDTRVGFDEAVVEADDGGRAHPVLGPAAVQLDEYFAGSRRDFDLPLDAVGSDFRLEAWSALRTIPYGETISYGEQASRLGRPSASRAVGSANGDNPISIVVPCHRVVGADGSLVGFAGGLDVKRWLIDHERAHTAAS